MNAFFIVCVIAAFAILPIPALQAVLATTASTLFESTPFILAGTLLVRIAPRRGTLLAALFGCGCNGGPGALSLPVAAATCLSFGPLVACARWVAALAVARLLRRSDECAAPLGAAGDLRTLLPFAIGAGVMFALLPGAASVHPAIALAGATAFAALASPCGFGTIALAATLHHAAPMAAVAILCIAGIIDVRSIFGNGHRAARHDGPAYLLAAISCALLAWHQGNTLVNPRFTIPLWCSAVALLILAWHFRHSSSATLRIAPAIMCAAAIMSAPAPAYYATETTLNDAFAGEELTFDGVLTKDNERASLVRYAITCCRADAQPVAVRLKNALDEPPGQWIEARGKLVRSGSSLALAVESSARIPAPADPFLYR